ncbi:MAG: glycosyltransferase family 39 protein [Candidatus Omnitrophica bacterium]|nr:glycosyltransferase family 39 protein [Candidatus Omnitrophota bacterium]
MESLDWDYVSFIRIPFALFGAGIVFLVFLFGKELYDEYVGMVAAFLLATSTYHIGFSRCAITTGDILMSFFLLLSLLLFYRGVKKQNQRYLLFAGIATGLACASKFTALLLLPIYFGCCFFIIPNEINSNLTNKKQGLSIPKRIFPVMLCNTIFAGGFLFLSAIITKSSPESIKSNEIAGCYYLASLSYIVVLLILIKRIPRIFSWNHKGILLLNITMISLIIMFIGSPVHLRWENIAKAMTEMKMHYSSSFSGQGYAVNIAQIVLVRFGIICTILFLIGIFDSLANLRNKANGFITISILFFLIVFLSVRNIISWYLVPIFPLMFVVCSRQIVRIFRVISRKSLRVIFCGICILFIVIRFLGIVNISPHYQLDGFAWGGDCVGYYKPSFVLVYGIGKTIRWMENNIEDYSAVGLASARESFIKNEIRNIFNAFVYSRNTTISYDVFDTEDEVKKYDYIITSAIYKRDWVNSCPDLLKIHSISLGGLELYEIYKVRLINGNCPEDFSWKKEKR